MNAQQKFWNNSTGWPRDNAEYVFLARAVHAIGKSMYGLEWTREEPCLELMHPLSIFPVSSGWQANLAHDLLAKHHPEFNRQPRRRSPGPHSFEFTGEEWMAAVTIVKKQNEEKRPGVDRFLAAQDRIVQLAETGQLVTAIREIAGGGPRPIDRALWNSERIRNRFTLCQMNPRDPFGIGMAGDGYCWIFVTRESLQHCLSLVRGGPSEMPQDARMPLELVVDAENKPQKISIKARDQAFKEWRKGRGDNIPSEREDFDYMRRFGVSRDAVRELRRSVPKLPRGRRPVAAK